MPLDAPKAKSRQPSELTAIRPERWVTERTGHMGNTFALRVLLMPWKECSVMDERVRFVGRLLDGESIREVCREFGISRKTGYKI